MCLRQYPIAIILQSLRCHRCGRFWKLAPQYTATDFQNSPHAIVRGMTRKQRAVRSVRNFQNSPQRQRRGLNWKLRVLWTVRNFQNSPHLLHRGHFWKKGALSNLQFQPQEVRIKGGNSPRKAFRVHFTSQEGLHRVRSRRDALMPRTLSVQNGSLPGTQTA